MVKAPSEVRDAREVFARERLTMSLLRNIPQAELGGQLKEIGLPLGPRLAIVSAIGEE